MIFYMLDAPENDKGHPLPPSRQLCTQWVVKAWDCVSEALVRNAWNICGYKSMDDPSHISSSENNSIVRLHKSEVATLIEKIAGPDASAHYLNEENYDPVLSLGCLNEDTVYTEYDTELNTTLEEGTYNL